MNRDPRLLYGADIRKRILDEVEEIAVYIRGQARAAAAVDIGINQVTNADRHSRIVSEADTGAVSDVASWTTPCRAGSARSRWQC